jgi:class 3 adenylate cyclase/tetratricopeptide (TPR) repeat protein
MRVYRAQGKHAMVETSYRRCRSALEQLGLRISPALDEVYGAGALAAPSSPDLPEGHSGPSPARYKEERRLVSVLFVELSGPGGFHRLDPEDLRDVIGTAVVELISAVERLGGTVTSVSGAGLAALFGAPTAHEDDPERAVRAAYRMLSSLAGRGWLSLRAGVETGLAVLGPIGKGARVSYGAVGEVVGAAAALQSLARPGSVLVGPVTQAATEGLFEWGPTEEVAASPGNRPMTAAYIERPKARPAGQAGRRRLAGSAPLVGRGPELTVLRQAMREATAGKGGVVLVAGEPGLGKTRLVQECRKLFMAWVGAASGRLPLWLEGRAASYASSDPYGLYQQLLAAWVGVAPDEGAGVVATALDRALKAVFAGQAPDEETRVLSQVMGLGLGKADDALARLSPEQLQRATFAALQKVVSRLVAYGPTVLVLEDLHWADPTSLHITAEIASLTKQGPLLLVLTRRPEPDPGVSALEAALGGDTDLRWHKLDLSPLAEGAERDLAQALLGEGTGYEVVTALARGAEGNPLFMEERLSSLLETGALVGDEAGWHLQPGLSGQVPQALERLVQSRVDRLDPGPHDAIVAASVLGSEFALSAVSALTDIDGGPAGAVSELCSSGLLVELRQVPEPLYRFRHGLIQEATYNGLLRDQRRHLHARAAWGLEAVSEGKLEEVAGVLGHHFALAGEADRAVHYLELAGDRAASAFANDEAVTSYRYALDVLGRDSAEGGRPGSGAGVEAAAWLRAKLGEVLLRAGRNAEARDTLREALRSVGADDGVQAARLHALLGRVEVADHSYDAALAAFDAADELIGAEPENQDQATVDLWLEVQLDGRAFVYYWRNETDKAAAVVAAARPLVEARGTPARKQAFHHSFVMQRMREDRYRIDEEILVNCRAAVAAAQDSGREAAIAFQVFVLGFSLLWYGDLDQAQQQLEASLASVERIGDVVLRARCLCYLDVTALRRHDVDAVRSLAPQAMEAAHAASYPEYVAAAKAAQAWVAWQDGRPSEVLELGGEALGIWATTVVSYSWYWICLWPLIAVHLSEGRLDEAVGAARQLLPPPQQRLPDELEAAVRTSIDAWENGELRLAREALGDAVALAKRLRYT